MPSWQNPCKHADRLDFGHLGGTSTMGDPDSWFPELWDWLIASFQPRSALDVGCGVGYAQRYFHECGLATLGIDCQQVLAHHLLPDRARAHDLTLGPCLLAGPFDLVWCCEVAEHIEERYVGHLVDTLVQNCAVALAFCSAPPGAGGHHHVNCQAPGYWVDLLQAAGLVHRQDLTARGRELCPEGNGRCAGNYFRRSGLIFTRKG